MEFGDDGTFIDDLQRAVLQMSQKSNYMELLPRFAHAGFAMVHCRSKEQEQLDYIMQYNLDRIKDELELHSFVVTLGDQLRTYDCTDSTFASVERQYYQLCDVISGRQ